MNPEYQAVSFGPGDEVPEWAVDQVGAHVLEPEDPADADESGEAEEDEQAGGESPADESGEDETPPPSDEQPDFTAPAPARRGRSRKQ